MIFDDSLVNYKIDELRKQVQKLDDIHVACSHCGIIGHKVDMKAQQEAWVYMPIIAYYHNECYAEKYKMHLCPNKCGHWLPNKEKK